MAPADDGWAGGESGDATRMLRAAAGGDALGEERLAALLYSELRALAAGFMAREQAEHTLQPTALVHEVWLKLFDREELGYSDRAHFLSTAARAMRQILVDHARGKRRVKRGGGWRRVEAEPEAGDAPAFELDGLGGGAGDVDLVELDVALERLRAHAPRQADVVELRYFGGLPVEETARVLGVSERTVLREWRFAKAWLVRELGA